MRSRKVSPADKEALTALWKSNQALQRQYIQEISARVQIESPNRVPVTIEQCSSKQVTFVPDRAATGFLAHCCNSAL